MASSPYYVQDVKLSSYPAQYDTHRRKGGKLSKALTSAAGQFDDPLDGSQKIAFLPVITSQLTTINVNFVPAQCKETRRAINALNFKPVS